MINSHEGESNKGKKYLYHEVKYTSEYKYTYTWYEQNGAKRMESKKEKLVDPRKKKSAQTKSLAKKTPTKSKPKNVPKKTAPPKKVAKPTFNKSKPAPVGQFIFEKKKPVKKQVVVPQPPPSPGPKPRYIMPDQESISKYEYLYGIKNLEIKHMQYINRSIYVSKPINAEGNVMSVSMQAVEEHPVFDELSGKANDRQTSVEYYIASVGTNPNPTPDEWYPILPEDVRTVKSELIMFGTARTAKLRFPALIGSKDIPAVYKNGLVMDSNDWSFIDGGEGMRLLVEKDPTAIYTIDYAPNAEFYNPWVIDVNQQNSRPVKVTQEFPEGTNHNKGIVLEKYPFIDYEKINTDAAYDPNLSSYVPFKVTLKDAGIIGPSRTTYKEVSPYNGKNQLVYTKNITNYKTGHNEKPKPYSIDRDALYNAFEYYQEGNKLFFTETFNKADIMTNTEDSHGNANIAVEYEYLSSDFRMKIILRRNSSDENTLTPIVHEYTLKFKVMK